MNILIGCEESQTICKAFRDKEFNAYSCDLRPTRGNPDWHYHMNIFDCFDMHDWDLIILHPPCTAMCLCGNRTYGKGKLKYEHRKIAVEWTKILWKRACKKAKHVALENPSSVIFKYMINVQYVQPWQFGHPVNKLTGFALKNLPRLKATNIVSNPQDLIHNMPPSKNRGRIRSVTFPGIANAIVDQWGSYLKLNMDNKK
jgi:hypothetical protein